MCPNSLDLEPHSSPHVSLAAGSHFGPRPHRSAHPHGFPTVAAKLAPLLLPAPASSQKYTLKLYVCDSGEVYWEIRLIFKAMFARVAKLQPWKLLHVQESSWREAAFGDLGFDWGAEFRPSQLSAHMRRGEGALADEKARQKATLTTDGFVAGLML